VREYCDDVRGGNFPSDAESYHAMPAAQDRKKILIRS